MKQISPWLLRGDDLTYLCLSVVYNKWKKYFKCDKYHTLTVLAYYLPSDTVQFDWMSVEMQRLVIKKIQSILCLKTCMSLPKQKLLNFLKLFLKSKLFKLNSDL